VCKVKLSKSTGCVEEPRPHSVISIFFDRTSRQDDTTDIRQHICIGFVVSVHLVVIAWCRERDNVWPERTRIAVTVSFLSRSIALDYHFTPPTENV
jgi:hypothetical protein